MDELAGYIADKLLKTTEIKEVETKLDRVMVIRHVHRTNG